MRQIFVAKRLVKIAYQAWGPMSSVDQDLALVPF
jgi:hypothetical protein